MNHHFCKVGRIRTNNASSFSLKDLETKYNRFIEEAYNIEQTDMSLSDILFFEARKLKQRISSLKRASVNDFDAAI